MAREDPEVRAARAAELSAHQIRRFYKKGGARVNSSLLPLIYKLAPLVAKVTKKETLYLKEWQKPDKFKHALKNFRT